MGVDGDDKGVRAEPNGNDAPRALLALYDNALPVVYGYFVRRCADRAAAEDLTSETFLAAMDAARKDTPPPMTCHGCSGSRATSSPTTTGADTTGSASRWPSYPSRSNRPTTGTPRWTASSPRACWPDCPNSTARCWRCGTWTTARCP